MNKIRLDIIMIDIKNQIFDTNSYTTFSFRKVKNSYIDTIRINISICMKCGNYIESSKSMEEKIYCKCTDIYGSKCEYIHRKKFSKVLDELILTMYTDDFQDDGFNGLMSRYYHTGECTPDSRTCYSCWRYWCICCGGGVGGMYGNCIYKRCRVGRKNCNLEC